MLVSSLFETVRAETGDISTGSLPRPLVRLQVASGLTIDFQSQNGQTVAGKTPANRIVKPKLPRLRQNGLSAGEGFPNNWNPLAGPPGTEFAG